MRRWKPLVLAAAMAGCTAPEVKSVVVTAADGSALIHTDGGLKVTTEVKPGSNSLPPLLTLSHVAPAGPSVPRPLSQTGTSNGIETRTSLLAAGDATVPLDQGSTWTARVDVSWTYLWTDRTETMSVPFQVLEPSTCFGFVSGPGSPRWTLNGYFKNDRSTPVTAITPATFPPENFPQARPGDASFGFTISPIATNGWRSDDMWSAEFISPALSGMIPAPAWAEMNHYKVQVRTDAQGMKLQAMITKLSSDGTSRRTYRLEDSNSNPVFFTLANDDAWHEFEIDFSPLGLPPGHVLTVSLRVFGTTGEIAANIGKKVMIDQVCRAP